MLVRIHHLRVVTAIAALSLLPGCSDEGAGPSTRTISINVGIDQGSDAGDALTDPAIRLLGQFKIESGKAIISDPCYPIDPNEEPFLSAVLDNVKNGDWKAEVAIDDLGQWGRRCVELRASHVDQNITEFDAWTQGSVDIGVDSGQAGIFDAKSYGNDSLVPKDYQWQCEDSPIDPDQPWYSLCCDQTLTELGAGVIPGGVVSSSGLGDGGYQFFTLSDDQGQIAAIHIVFVSADERHDMKQE